MVFEFVDLLVESYGTWLLLQRLVDASKDSDIPKNVPFAFAINNRNTCTEDLLPGYGLGPKYLLLQSRQPEAAVHVVVECANSSEFPGHRQDGAVTGVLLMCC